jgi:hypothetical protein
MKNVPRAIKAHGLGRWIVKKTIELFYRDGNNDKAWWEIEVDSKLLDKILDVEYYEDEVIVRHEDIEMEEFGLTMMDIPFPFGYCPEFDHNFVNIMAIDGVDIEDYIKQLKKEIA